MYVCWTSPRVRTASCSTCGISVDCRPTRESPRSAHYPRRYKDDHLALIFTELVQRRTIFNDRVPNLRAVAPGWPPKLNLVAPNSPSRPRCALQILNKYLRVIHTTRVQRSRDPRVYVDSTTTKTTATSNAAALYLNRPPENVNHDPATCRSIDCALTHLISPQLNSTHLNSVQLADHDNNEPFPSSSRIHRVATAEMKHRHQASPELTRSE